jgi:hypothetical protein
MIWVGKAPRCWSLRLGSNELKDVKNKAGPLEQANRPATRIEDDEKSKECDNAIVNQRPALSQTHGQQRATTVSQLMGEREEEKGWRKKLGRAQ